MSNHSLAQSDIKLRPAFALQVVKEIQVCNRWIWVEMYSWFILSWQKTVITPTVLLCKLMVCLFEKCIITCEVTERTSYHNSYRPKHQESGNSLNIVLPPALYSSNHKMILWRETFPTIALGQCDLRTCLLMFFRWSLSLVIVFHY